jgi:hypothetical protein
MLKEEKLEIFLSLTRTHKDIVNEDWDKRDRGLLRKDLSGEVICVYRENPSKSKCAILFSKMRLLTSDASPFSRPGLQDDVISGCVRDSGRSKCHRRQRTYHSYVTKSRNRDLEAAVRQVLPLQSLNLTHCFL